MSEIPESLRNEISADEKIIFFGKSGFFGGKKFQMITDKRILEVAKGESKEKGYLNEGEQVKSPVFQNSCAVNWRDELGNLTGAVADLLLWTNKRILFFRLINLAESPEYEIPLELVDRVHIGRKKPRNIVYGLKAGVEEIVLVLRAPEALCSILTFLGEQERLWITLSAQYFGFDPSHFRKGLEDFTGSLCEAVGLPLSPPERYVAPPDWVDKEPEIYKTGTVVEFYVKTNIKWPEKCSSCERHVDEYEFDIIKLNIKGQKPTFLSPIEYKVPYCDGCYKERNLKSAIWKINSRKPAVKEYWDFNGINALIWFENESYALEFIETNT